MRVADAIANWLAEKKIFTAFGIVGGGNVVLFDAIQAKGATEIICCHHEQAAVMASNSFNRVRGNLESVVLCTTGAGSTNAITGVMAAWMDSIPLLVLSGNEASTYLDDPNRVLGVQGYRSADFIRPAAKYAARASAFDWQLILYGAYGDALTPRQGPVWIDIPKDVQNAAC
jgi:acetolactate synthase-1/2/3 large subunit